MTYRRGTEILQQVQKYLEGSKQGGLQEFRHRNWFAVREGFFDVATFFDAVVVGPP